MLGGLKPAAHVEFLMQPHILAMQRSIWLGSYHRTHAAAILPDVGMDCMRHRTHAAAPLCDVACSLGAGVGSLAHASLWPVVAGC